jgi:hypothetical protein
LACAQRASAWWVGTTPARGCARATSTSTR